MKTIKLRKMTITSYVLVVIKLNFVNFRTVHLICIKINYKDIKHNIIELSKNTILNSKLFSFPKPGVYCKYILILWTKNSPVINYESLNH